MDNQTDSGTNLLEKPVILLFSTRERIGNILNVALMQCNYRILLANTSYLAMIKTNQFLPDLVIVDITPNNTKDVLLVNRLQKSPAHKKDPHPCRHSSNNPAFYRRRAERNPAK